MPAIPIERFTEKIALIYEGRECAASTIRQIKQVLREFSELKAKGRRVVRTTADLTDEAIAHWRKAFPHRTPVTARSHLRCLHSICAWAITRNFLKHSPFERFGVNDWGRQDSRPGPPRRQWSISPAETRRVLSLASQEASRGSWEAARLEAYVYTLFLSGARPDEIGHLELKDFNPARRTLSIHAKLVPKRGGRQVWWRPKSAGSAGELAIGDALVELLQVWSRRTGCAWLFPGKKLRGPWVTGGPGVRPLDQVTELGRRAGVPSLRRKAGRKGLGTHKAIGLTSMERRCYFRHADDETGDAYDDEQVESMREAAAKIERFYLSA
jgi:integrase